MYPQELAHARRQLKKGDKGEVRGNILPLKRGADGNLSLAMPQMLRDAGVGLLDLLAGTRTGEVTPEATGLLFDIAGGGAASAPLRSAGVGIFGGKLAKTADTQALQRAEQMAGAGADRGDIWNDTGWFQGADGKWRFEIDDSGATYSGPNTVHEEPVADILQHEQLYSAYPDTAKIPAEQKFETGMMPGHAATYYGGEGGESIAYASGRKPEVVQSSMLHELQHGVQAREGFAKGDGGFMLRPNTPAWDIYRERLEAITTPRTLDEYVKEAGFDSADEALPSYRTYVKDIEKMRRSGVPAYLDRAAQEYAVKEGYRRSGGEVEARNVQTRRDMTPEERAARPPWETQDVPDEQQIVRFGSGPSLMASLAKGTANQAGKGDRYGEGSIRAYHGSPHDFDKFDLSKLGTGEGNQAYGHGLYFAENEDVARQYRDMLAGLPSVDGSQVFAGIPWSSRSTEKLARTAMQNATSAGLTGDEAVRRAVQELSHQGNQASASHVRQPYYDAANEIGRLIGKDWQVNPGKIYEVNIHADPDRFLDWDRPLSAMGEPVQQALTEAGLDRPEYWRPGIANPPVGADVWREYRNTLGGSYGDMGINATQALREAGISGIKYLDQGSRGASEGSRNYVAFDDGIIEMLRKYAIMGGPPLPMSTLASEQDDPRRRKGDRLN